MVRQSRLCACTAASSYSRAASMCSTPSIVTIMLQYDFMQQAFAASGIVALVSGVVGYFLVLRGQAFAGHALSHVGFAGATASLLIGVAPVWGLIGLSVAAGAGMGSLGERIAGRDVAI